MNPLPTSRRKLALGELLAWAVILVSIGTLFGILLIVQITIPIDRTNESRDGADLQILMDSRYVIGASALLNDHKNDATIEKGIDTVAKTSWDKLRAAIVHGELSGGPAALNDFDTLDHAYPELHTDIRLLRPIYQNNAPVTRSPLSPEWQNFYQRNGWFADLALSFNKPANDALRTTVLNAGIRTLLAMLGVVLLGLLFLVAGLALLIVAIVLVATKKVRPVYALNPQLPADRRAYIEAFAWFMGVYLGLGVLIRYVFKLDGMAWGMVELVAAVGMGLAWPLIRRQSWSQYKAAMGLHTGRGIFTELACGALGYVMGAPIMALGMLATMLLTKWTGVDASHPIMREIAASSLSQLIFLLLLATVWAPITEELMFRGAFFSNLRERFGWWISAPIVALCFAMIHPQGFAGVPLLAAVALTLAGIREWRGSIFGCMMAHCLNNTLAMIFLLVAIS